MANKNPSKPRPQAARRAAPMVLPPYGHINADNASYLARRPVPDGFRLIPAQPAVSGADEWERWLARLAGQMSDFLWPVFLQGRWEGAAAANAVALTEADLALMAGAALDRLDARIVTAAGPSARQRTAWQLEDDAPPGPSFDLYGAPWPKALESEVTRAVLSGGIDLARPASQGLKRLFQRPRPQLTSLLLGRPALQVLPSKSAITPSMVSGHCIQGMLALAQVFVAMRPVLDAKPELSALVQRFWIDTGDRRVFAGLHYPSDNVGSWYASLRLCPHLFGADALEVRDFLWKAIRKRSAVFHALQQAVTQAPESPYALLMRHLASAAAGKEPPV